MVAHLHIGKMFIGVDGISVEGGITTHSEQEAQIAKALMMRAQETYAIFDHTKVGKTSLFSIAALTDVHAYITDAALDGALADYAAEQGARVYLATH